MKFFLSWLVLMGVAFPAHPAPVRVGPLQLNPDPAWQQGSAKQEGEDDAVQLSWAILSGIALQLLVPRSPPLIKSDEAHFFQNLTRKWSAQFGKAADIHWIKFNQPGQSGLRWLACRHPARSDDGVVFHLVTVHEDHAYSLLLFTPPGTELLPPAALALVAGATFGAPAPAPEPEPAPVSTTMTTQTWRRTASLTVVPQGAVLDALIQAESDALAEHGMLTGFGLEAEPTDKVAKTDGNDLMDATGTSLGTATLPGGETLHMAWFLDGFRWQETQGREVQQPFETRGRLQVQAHDGKTSGSLSLGLQVTATEEPLEVRAEVLNFCGPAELWERAWSEFGVDTLDALSRLATDHACELAPREAKGLVLQAKAGQSVEGTLALPPYFPADRLWVEIQLMPASGVVGAGLLKHSRLVVVYEPEIQAKTKALLEPKLKLEAELRPDPEPVRR